MFGGRLRWHLNVGLEKLLNVYLSGLFRGSWEGENGESNDNAGGLACEVSEGSRDQ